MRKQIRNKDGRFARAKSSIKAFIVVSMVLGAVYSAGVYNSTRTVEVVKAQEVDNLGPKIEQLKGEVLDIIKDCERKNYTEDDAPITWDPHKTNKKVEPLSFGLYQFKIPTIQWYYKTLYGKDITRKEAVLIALDYPKARELASSIIFDSKSGTADWINCGENNQKIQTKILVIKELQK